MAIPPFSPQQWDFLAVLHALETPVAIDVVGELVPLTPKPLFDLIHSAKALGLMHQTGEGVFALASELPSEVEEKLERLNSAERKAALLERLHRMDLLHRIEKNAAADLMIASGKILEAAVLKKEQAEEALKAGDLGKALGHLEGATDQLASIQGQPEADTLFLSAALALSNLYSRTGQSTGKIAPLLLKVKGMAERMGDSRSKALIGLHFGRYYYSCDRLADALENLTEEIKIIRDIGDEDIMAQSAEFFGLYYYLVGQYQEATEYLDRAVRSAEDKGDRFLNWPVPAYLGYCAAVSGQFHRAVGILDANWRRAQQLSQPALAAHCQAVLGSVLLLMGRTSEAGLHLQAAREGAAGIGHILSQVIAEIALAYLDLKEGRPKVAYETIKETLGRMSKAGFILRRYPSPFILELLFGFHRRGYAPLPQLDFQKEMARVLAEENCHMKGVAFRLQALAEMDNGMDSKQVLADLSVSQDLLKCSGDPIELAKTRVELARLRLSMGETEIARKIALMAWEVLLGYQPTAFPDELRFLLEGPMDTVLEIKGAEDDRDRFLSVLMEILPSPDLDDLFNRLVEAMNRFLRAERGGLFWFSRDRRKAPILRAGRNLDRDEAASKDFQKSLSLIFKSYREARPIVSKAQRSSSGPGGRNIVCLPFQFQGSLQGVLYHDIAYEYDSLQSLDEKRLTKLAGPIGTYLERIHEYGRLREELNLLASERKLRFEGPEVADLLFESPAMQNLMAVVNKVAATDSTVLISGETGVGKELLARRIHHQSSRKGGALIVVDPSSLPENLVESELFGHEKGAFTGAQQQNLGRLELAHGGTLFIDELSEIPLSVQVKLLRALQERSFMRLGGSRIISSDFRLLAATNRNLETEVSAGRFRQDLFFRLNVVPLHVPPLRERGPDIILLARHFVGLFARRFNRPEVFLSGEDEDRLIKYHWPGNIRELKNILERAVLLSDGPSLQIDLAGACQSSAPHPFADFPALDEVQRRYIRQVLARTGGRIAGPDGAAEVLGLNRTSLYARMRKLGLR